MKKKKKKAKTRKPARAKPRRKAKAKSSPSRSARSRARASGLLSVSGFEPVGESNPREFDALTSRDIWLDLYPPDSDPTESVFRNVTAEMLYGQRNKAEIRLNQFYVSAIPEGADLLYVVTIQMAILSSEKLSSLNKSDNTVRDGPARLWIESYQEFESPVAQPWPKWQRIQWKPVKGTWQQRMTLRSTGAVNAFPQIGRIRLRFHSHMDVREHR